MTVETKNRVEKAFKDRCITQGVKFKSKKFYELQAEFFAGAMSVLNEIPPDWGINIMTGREIINY